MWWLAGISLKHSAAPLSTPLTPTLLHRLSPPPPFTPAGLTLNSLSRSVYMSAAVCVCLSWPVSLMQSSEGRSIRLLQPLDYDAYFLLNKLL